VGEGKVEEASRWTAGAA